MIIDAHILIFPETIVTNAVKEPERQYGVNAIGSATVGIRPGMNKANVDASVLLKVATRPDQVESINNWISGICKDYPGIIQLGAMHPNIRTRKRKPVDAAYCHPTIRRKSQPGRGQPCPTP